MEDDKRKRKNKKKKGKQSKNVENGVGEAATRDQNLVSNNVKDERTDVSETAANSNGVGEMSTRDQNLASDGKDEPAPPLETANEAHEQSVNWNGVVEVPNGDQNVATSGKDELNQPTESADRQSTNVDSNGVNGHLPNGKECATSEETIKTLGNENDILKQNAVTSDETIGKLKGENAMLIQKETTSEETIKKLKEENDTYIQKEAISEDIIRNLKAENAMHIQKEAISEETIRKLKEQNDIHMQKEVASEETTRKLKEHDMRVQKEAILEDTIRKLNEENDMHMKKEAISEETISKLKKENAFHIQKEAISEETIKKLKEENDEHVYKEVTLEELIKKLQAEKELQTQKQTELEMKIAQLQGENNSLIQREAGLVEKTNLLLNEKVVLSLKGESLERKINLLESDLSSFSEKESGLEMRIAQLQRENDSLIQKEAELVGKTNQLLNEKTVLSLKGESLEQKVNLLDGDSEEAAAALSQALRNRIERALLGLYYMRFGDVFSKFHQFQSEELFRRGQPSVEFVFAATEEAIFVHVIVSSKHVRTLSTGDLERLLKHSTETRYRLPVIVSPHGIRGSLTGCSPSDLVKQSYLSSSAKFRVSNGIIGLPYHVSQGVGCQLRGQNCFVEVSLGFPRPGTDKALQLNKNGVRNLPKLHAAESPVLGRSDHKGSPDHLSDYEKTFLYPAEAVLVPVLQTSLARSSLRRFWLQNWMGPSLPGSCSFVHCAGNVDSTEDPWSEINGTRTQNSYDSSSNSNSSSISSLSDSSSDSDFKTTGPSELEADADSLTCRQSTISSADQLENDGPKLGSKRSRMAMTESLSTATNVPVQDAYMSDFGSMEVNNSAITRVGNESVGSYWDWDDEDRGMEMDIQALLSEFGDFGDFFENDVLPFGEPPGTAESQTLMFSAPDCGDVNSSPVGAMMDVSDQMLLPVGFSSFECFNPPPPSVMEECLDKSQDNLNNSMSSGPTNQTQMLYTKEFDHIMKAEAMMTFAPEFGAVETPTSELSTTLFRSPYFPKSRKADSSYSSSNNYLYGAAPPSSPYVEGSESKNGVVFNTKTGSGKHDASMSLHSKNYYTFVQSRKDLNDKKPVTCNDNSIAKSEGIGPPQFSNIGSNAVVKSVLRKMTEGTNETEHSLLSAKTLLATDISCAMLQASMCRSRHVLLSSSNLIPVGLNRSSGVSFVNHLPIDPSTNTDNISGKYEVKKKENIPVRIAGDIDGGILDGHLNAPVGVWRTVGASKVVKPSNSPNMEIGPSFSHNSFNEEGILSYGQRKPLQELLDGIAFLVQQAISFVDLALDADCGDGPYGLLALQEQWRRGFCCGPSMVHAGCGGTLSSSHSLDIAGLELVDPLSSDVHASTLINLLQSDIKMALKSAFSNLEGPLSVTDWCQGRNQSVDIGSIADCISAESSISECRDSSDPMSPSQSSSGIKVSSMMDNSKVDENSQRRCGQDMCNSESEQQPCSRLKPTLVALPFPSILVGYQDDWLKTSANCLQHWEKAPLEPYALQKPITYHVICPDIDPLTSAAADFFQQLGTVYETCKLGTHSPQGLGNQMEIESAKSSSCGFVLLDCPQSMKIESSNASLVGSVSDYFLSLSNGWDLTSYLKSLSKALRALNLSSSFSTNPSEGSNCSCLVIYVVCPFPDPTAILQTVIESSVSIGSVIQQSDRERRSSLHSQVVKALSGLATVDEASASNILVLSGFSIPKLVLQIVTVDAIFRVTSPSVSELVILKETAFTVYNKARRISRGISNDFSQLAFSSRSQSVLTQMPSPISGMWKDCVGPRMGHSLPREGDIDASLRPSNWDNSWQPTRTGVLSCDPSRSGDILLHDEIRYMFEPLFILAEPGSPEHGISVIGSPTSESSKALTDDSSANYVQSTSTAGSGDSASSIDGSGSDQKTHPSLHCCYGWTEDWRWLVCIWTDSRGELLDCNIFPFGGISSRQDTKGLQCLFVQVLQQGCLILQSCDSGLAKPRDFVIARIGGFYELEYLEWQKALYSVGGSEMKRWPLQLRKSLSDGVSATSNGSSLQQSDMSLIPERTLPSSPSPLYSPHAKPTAYMKANLGQPAARKQLMGGHSMVDNSRGLLHWAQSISFVAVSMDHTLKLVLPSDSSSPGYVEGFTPVKSLGSTSSAYILIPSPSMRFLPPTALQLPTCLTAESPPLAHLLHSKGSALPLSTGFVVSKAVPSMRKDHRSNLKEEWPSVLSVNLIDYYGGSNIQQEKFIRGINKQGGRGLSWDAKDFEVQTHLVLESLAAELHALSWMTVSPAYLERRTALPFHCDMVIRLRRLLHFADKELFKQSEKS